MNVPRQQFATYNPQQQFLVGAAAKQGGNNSGSLYAWQPPSPLEQQYYDVLFTHADDQRRNAISGKQAVAFFFRSHLDKAILREIWSLADSQQRSELSRNEFYVAMRLISMGQRGEEVSIQRFSQYAAMQYPLPVIEGFPPPLEMSQPTQLHQNYPQNLSSMPLQSSRSYALTAEEKSKYDLVFRKYDTDRDGLLMGGEAVALFQMSGLDRNVLRDIWAMADITQDSKLNLQEFYVAMHLIVCVSKRGLPMPPSLPPELRQAVFGSSNSTAQDTPEHASLGLHIEQRAQEKNLPPKLEGMSAFDSFSVSEDVPLPSYASFTPQANFNYATDGSITNHHVEALSDAVHAAPMQQGFVAPLGSGVFNGKDCEHSVNLMPNVSGMAPEPPRLPDQKEYSYASGSNAHVQEPRYQFAAFPAISQANSGLEAENFGVYEQSSVSIEKQFLAEEKDKKVVGELDEINEQVTLILDSVERKQTTIEMISESFRELDELRHELVTLVVKRDRLRSALASSSLASDNSTDAKVIRAVELTLQNLVDNQKKLVQQLQRDISRHEGELEESILSAKLQQKMSLDPQPSLIATGATQNDFDAPKSKDNSPPPAPPLHDIANLLPSPVVTTSAPFISAFTSNATSTSDLDAFNNLGSFTRSNANTRLILTTRKSSNSLISPTPSSSQHAIATDTLDAFDFSQTKSTPSLLAEFEESPTKSLFSVQPPTAKHDTPFDAFADTVVPSADLKTETSTYSIVTPSPAAINDLDLNDIAELHAAESAAKSICTESCASLDPVTKTEAFKILPFLPPPASKATNFDAFAAPPLSINTMETSTKSVANEILIFSPVKANSKECNAFDNFGAATVNASENEVSFNEVSFTATSTVGIESSSKVLEPFGNSLGPTSMPTENLPSSQFASDKNDFDDFGDFSSASVESIVSSSASQLLVDDSEACTQDDFGAALDNVASTYEPLYVSGNLAAKTPSSGFDAFNDSHATTEEMPNSTVFSHFNSKANDFDSFNDGDSTSTLAKCATTILTSSKQVESDRDAPFVEVNSLDSCTEFSRSSLDAAGDTESIKFGFFDAASGIAGRDFESLPENFSSAAFLAPAVDEEKNSPVTRFISDASDLESLGNFESTLASAESAILSNSSDKLAESTRNPKLIEPASPVEFSGTFLNAMDDTESNTFGNFTTAASEAGIASDRLNSTSSPAESTNYRFEASSYSSASIEKVSENLPLSASGKNNFDDFSSALAASDRATSSFTS
ncbi:hypothetical protein CCR75_003465 [Bremia lactucae]|uniref:Calmodulin n=1 Tax=Bremia lactucae TaxID=4779 RepID=A0A976IDT0_BRELC|nr:hypothetical protein CCR75_003465 [Bremia lactucae]